MATKLNLSALKTKTPGTKAKKAYPQLPTTPLLVETVDAYIEKKAELDAIEGEVKGLAANLKEAALPAYFQYAFGKTAPESSIEILGTKGTVAICATNRYPKAITEDEVIAAIGAKAADSDFYEKLTITVDGDKVPADKRQLLINKIAALTEELGLSDDAIKAELVYSPTKEFHTARWTKLSLDKNLALNTVCPAVTQIKIKRSGDVSDD